MSMVMDDQLVEAEKVIYANPCKTRGYIKHAEKVGIRKMTFDNEEELRKILELHPSAEMILRIAVSDPTAQCPLNVKFGCDPVSEAPRLLHKAKELGVAVIGVSFHVGSGCNDPTAFRAAIGHARRLFDTGLEVGHDMKLLDIGGGFPGHDTPKISFRKIVDVISPCLDEFFPPHEKVEIIAEPGRFFASAPVSICCNVISATKVPASRITQIEADEGKDGYMYYINDGVYGSFNCILFDHYQPTGSPLFDPLEESPLEYPTTIWGPTCDGLDQVESHTVMRKMEVGDWVYYPNMGAYTTVAASKFNGFDKPKVYHMIDHYNWKQLYASDFP
ncbi:ornithine decarboxylase [Aphelenchoides avenae]|nr:ornithine decarboxylase [Aphelenchus avenae]